MKQEMERELLAFRHYLRHGSVVVSPDGERLAVLRKRVLESAPELLRDVDEFEQHLARLLTRFE